MPRFDDQVFINVPFDHRYEILFRALVFAVHDCGLTARCALDQDDGSQVRIEKLYDTIRDCRYGIHDLSRTQLDKDSRLPRFNMPLELGIFLGAKRFGSKSQHRKTCLILERDRYRYQKFCSDLAGQDIRAHGDDVETAIRTVRDWLSANVTGRPVPTAKRVIDRYVIFLYDLPRICADRGFDLKTLTFRDFQNIVAGWIDVTPR